MASFQNQDYEHLVSRVRNMLGLQTPHLSPSPQIIITTEVSSVVHSKPDQQLQGTFGKPETSTVDYEFETNKLRALQERCRAASRRIESSLEAERLDKDRQNSSKQKTKRSGDNKENNRIHQNSSLYLSAADDLGSGIKQSDRYPASSLSQSIELKALKNELEMSKDKQLQLRMECQRLTKELTKMHQEKELMYRQFERRCQDLADPKQKTAPSKYDNELIVNLNAELRQAKFVIQQLKLEAARQEYLQSGFIPPTKYTQMEEKLTWLLHQKFRLEEKVEFHERALNQNTRRSTLFAPDSRIKTLRESLEFWIRKSRRIEQQSYKIISKLREECENLKNDLLIENKQAQNELKRFVKKFQGAIPQNPHKDGRSSLSRNSATKARNRSISGTSSKPSRAVRYR